MVVIENHEDRNAPHRLIRLILHGQWTILCFWLSAIDSTYRGCPVLQSGGGSILLLEDKFSMARVGWITAVLAFGTLLVAYLELLAPEDEWLHRASGFVAGSVVAGLVG